MEESQMKSSCGFLGVCIVQLTLKTSTLDLN